MSEPKPTWYAPLNVEHISEHSFHTSDGLVQVVTLAISETLAREVLELRACAQAAAVRVTELEDSLRNERMAVKNLREIRESNARQNAELRERVALLEDDVKRAELIDILPCVAERFDGEVALIVGCGEDPGWSIALDVPDNLECRWTDDSPERLLATLKAELKR